MTRGGSSRSACSQRRNPWAGRQSSRQGPCPGVARAGAPASQPPLPRLNGGRVARDALDDPVPHRRPDHRRVHPGGKFTVGKLRKRPRKRRLARYLRTSGPPARTAKGRVGMHPVKQIPCGWHVPDRLGDKGPGKGGTIFPGGLPARLLSAGRSASGVANSSTVTSLRWRSERGPGISVRAGNNSS